MINHTTPSEMNTQDAGKQLVPISEKVEVEMITRRPPATTPFSKSEGDSVEYLLNLLQKNKLASWAAELRGAYDFLVLALQQLMYFRDLEKVLLLSQAEMIKRLAELDAAATEKYRQDRATEAARFDAKIEQAHETAKVSSMTYQVEKGKLEALPGAIYTVDELEQMSGNLPEYKLSSNEVSIEWSIRVVFGAILGTSLGLMIGLINPYKIMSINTLCLVIVGIVISCGVGILLILINRKAAFEEEEEKKRLEDEWTVMVEAAKKSKEAGETGVINPVKPVPTISLSRICAWVVDGVLLCSDIFLSVKGIFKMMFSATGNSTLDLSLYIACLVIVFPYLVFHNLFGNERGRGDYNRVKALAKRAKERGAHRGRSEKQDIQRHEELGRLQAVAGEDAKEVSQLRAEKAAALNLIREPVSLLSKDPKIAKGDLEKEIESAKAVVQKALQAFRHTFIQCTDALRLAKGEAVSLSFLDKFDRWLRS